MASVRSATTRSAPSMHLRASDPALARVIEAAGPFRLELQKTPSPFLALAEAIVYQQLNGKAAAATIFGRVHALFPRARSGFTAQHILRAPDEKLRGAGLSRNKLLALRDLAERRSAAARSPSSPSCMACPTTRSLKSSRRSAASAAGLPRCS